MPQFKNGKIVFKLPPTLSISFRQIIVIIIILGTASLGAVLYKSHSVRSANYGWAQTTWSGGASTTATGKHSTDQSGWTKYQSKSTLLSTSTEGQLTLKATSTFWTDTTSNNFASGTLSNTYTSNGTVYLKKPNGVSCAIDEECKAGACSNAHVCSRCHGVDYNNHCLYLSGYQGSCTNACADYGGSAGAYYDDSNCNSLKALGNSCSNCFSFGTASAPYLVFINGACNYGSGTGWTEGAACELGFRLCACNN